MTDAPLFHVDEFVAAVIRLYREHDCMDIDGRDFHDLCVKHGAFIERPATAEDAAEDWAYEYDISEGDPISINSPGLQLLLKRVQGKER